MRYSQAHIIIFLAPLVLIVVLMYAMVSWTVYASLNDWVGLASSWHFNGLDNYLALFRMERFWISLKNNLLWLMTFIPPTAFLGLVLAYVLELSKRAEAIFRPVFLYPMALSFVVTGTLWAWMYDPESGVINTILRSVGLDVLAQPWIASPDQALYCMMGAAIWQYTGFAMTIYMAAIRDIPDETLESAKVDGASEAQVFYHVVVPNVGHATMIVVAMLTLFSLKVFDLVWVMTMGGPGNSTEVLSYSMFVATFRQQLVGVGAAISVIILILAVVVVIPYSAWSMKRLQR